MYKLLIAYILTLTSFSIMADDHKNIEGLWINAKQTGVIELKIVDELLTGTIVDSLQPGTEGRKDENNPDPTLRDRPLQGLTILNDLNYTKDNLWKGGTIYDPDNGNTYDCKIKVIDQDTIELRGYLGISLFGRTETWQRKK